MGITLEFRQRRMSLPGRSFQNFEDRIVDFVLWGPAAQPPILPCMTNLPRPRIYLAGPDVFRPDVERHFATLAKICRDLGMEALRPSDGLMPAWCSDAETATGICRENMDFIRQSEGVIANLAPFRGVEPDSGTAFEVGVAVALGLPVVAYGIPPGTYADRVGVEMQVARAGDGTLRDPNGCLIEDLGLPVNLMLACSVKVVESAEEALQLLASLLDAAKQG
jgi:nucleoside 2-deoxyribosyltransferase